MTALSPDVVANLRLENARLLTELRAARDRQTASAEILRTIASTSGDAERSLQRIAETTAQLFGASSVTIRIASGDEWSRTINVGASAQRISSEVSAAQLQIGAHNLPGTVLRENRQIHIPDINNVDPAIADWPGLPPARSAGTRVLAGTPLRREQKAIGVLIVHRDRPEPFTAEELALQQSFADQAVIAIENARLFNETRESLDRQDATAEILRTIASAPGDAGRSLQQIAETSARLFGAPSVSIQLVEDGEWGEAYRFGDSALRIRSAVPLAKIRVGGPNMPGAVVGQNRQFHVRDLDHLDPSVADWPGLPHARAAGTRTMCGTPLRREGNAIGALIIYRDRLLPFTPEELALQQSFADQAVIAIENARLFNETQEALSRQIATAEILRVISQSPTDVRPVFDAIVLTSVRLLGCDSAFFLRCDDITYTPVAGTTTAGLLTELGSPQPIDPGANFPSRAIVEKKTLHVRDFSLVEVPEYDLRVHETFGINSALFLPLLREGKCIGLLALAGKRAGMFGESEITLAESFRDQALIAIENTRLFNETREALEHQTATSEVLQVIGNSMADAKPVFERIVNSIELLFDCRQIAIFLTPGDGLVHLAARRGMNMELMDKVYPQPIEQTAVPAVLGARQQIYYPDALNGANVPQSIRRVAQVIGNFSNVLTPMLWEGRGVGMIAVTREPNTPFNSKELSLLKTFADQAVIAIENARLFNETKEALERQTATAEILKVIASSPSDVQPVFEAIAESAKRLSEGHSATVTRAIGDMIHLAAFTAGSEAGTKELQSSFPTPLSSSGIHSRVARMGKLAFRTDIETEPDVSQGVKELARARGYRSILVVPMLREGVSIGTIGITRRDPGPFADNVIDLLKTFADQAVIAIENTRLFNETREALDRQTATAEILKVIASSPTDVQPVFDVIVERAVRLCGARMGRVYRYHDDVIQMVAGHGLNAPGLGKVQQVFPRPATDDTIAGQVMLSRRPYILADIKDDETVPALSRQMIEALGTRSQVTMPMLLAGEPIGAITVGWADPRAYKDQQITLLQTFADQAVIAIENVRLFNETREALERQTATADILKVIASSPSDVQPVFEAIAASANRLIGGFSSAVHRVIDDVVHLVAFTPTNPELDEALKAAFPIHRNEAAAVAMVQNGETAQVADAETADPQTRRLGRARGWRSVTFTPLMSQGAFIGFIACTRRETGVLGDHHVQLLRTFADQAVIAIQNVRLFNETREALERQTATADILKVIAGSPSDVQPVFEAIVGSAAKLFEPCAATIVTLRDEELHWKATAVLHPEFDVERAKAIYPLPFKPDHFPSARAIAERRIVEIPDSEAPDTSDTPRQAGRISGFRSATFVPLINSAQGIGTIILTHPQAGFRLSEKQLALVQTFADQAVIAIENVRLFNETKEALERQTATADILKVIASSPDDVQPVFDAIATSANRLVGGFSSTVFRFIDGVAHLKAFTPTNPAADEVLRATFPQPVAAFPPFRMAQAGEVTQIPDTEALSDEILEISRARGYRSMLFAPLMNDGVSIGFIAVTRVQPGNFTDHHVQLLQTFADQAVIAIENARLFDEVQAKTRDLSESLQQQTATADVLKVISRSAFDLQAVLDTLVESAARLCEADMAAITRQKGDEYFRAGSYGFTSEFMDYVKDIPVKPERSTITGRTLLEGKVIHVPDVHADPDYTFSEAQRLSGDPHTFLGVPLLREGSPVGALVLARRNMQPFTDKQVELVTTFADQAVIAIENVRLFDEVQAKTRDLTEALTYQTGSSNILRVIASSPTDVKPVLKAIVESACELCEADDALATLKDGEDLVFQAHHGSIPVVWGRSPINRQWVSGRAVLDREPVHVHDLLSTEGEGFPDARELARRSSVRTILSVPLLRENESIGAIVLRRTEVQPFSDKQISLLQTFADQAVIAIGNVRLFEEVQARTRDLTESLQQQTATAEVLKVISRSAFDLQAVFDTLISSAVELSGAFNGTICLREGDGFRYLATSGIQSDFSKFLVDHPPRPGRGSAAGRVLQSGNVESIPDVLEDPDYDVPAYGLNKTRSVLGVPLLRNDKVEGALVLARAEAGRFTERQIELVQTFADQAVIAIENVRLFDEVQARTKELAASLDDLRTAQDRLVQTEKLASLGQLTAGIAHEIKNPLNFVNNFSALSAELTDELNDVLKPAALSDKIRAEVNELTAMLKDNLEKVVQHGKRADSIVKNMLLHSREGSGEHRPADINALLDESLNLAYHGARAEKREFNITLQRDFDEMAGTIEVFPQEITRVLLNLISNGFYAVTKRKTENGSSGFDPVLRATTRSLGDTVEIRIRDNGTGIPAEVKEKMFNPFFTTKPAGEGTGLGLSMSHDIIVKQHGGTIDVETELGQFTEFTIVLPRTSNLQEKKRGQT
jgi:GAF domain-containing protein